VSVDSAVQEVLTAAAPVLGRSGNRWYLFGAQAVSVWGRPRMTADVDITVTIVECQDDFVAAMQRAGFDLRYSDWRGLAARTRVLPFLHRSTQLPLDLVLAGPGLEEEFLERAVVMSMAGTDVPVISPEDLIAAKLLAGRPKDVEDVRGIIELQKDRLDLVRVRSLLRLLEEALSRSDLSLEFERLVAAAQR
jgi:hypothetical protein